MTALSWLSAQARRYTFLPHLAGSFVVLLAAAFAVMLQHREEADARTAFAAQAHEFASLIEDKLRDRNRELTRLSTLWPNGAPGAAEWESEALHVMQSGSFRTLAWVDSAGSVIASVPDQRAGNTDIMLASERDALVRAARVSAQLTNTVPTMGAGGVAVVASAVPVQRSGAVVYGELSVSALLQRALDMPEASGYAIAVYSGPQHLLTRGHGDRALEEKWSAFSTVGDAGSEWSLRIWPSSAELRRHNSRLPEAVFAIGLLFAITIAVMMQMYQTADRRAHALSRANRLLEAEIKERERAQEALAQSEEQLRQSQKMEAVGRLAGGVAHDFNNLLTAINGYADFLLADIERSDPRRDDVREIKKAATRAGALTAQLLAFSRRQIRQPRPLDLNAVLSGLDRMLRRVIGEDVNIDWQPNQKLGSVMADPSELEQIMLNLIVNAGDAMPKGGTVTVRTSSVVFKDHTHPHLGAGHYVQLSVTDTGMGMDAETRSRIFEPFYTTKGPGKGTGLGLSTVYAIVQNIHGAIDVDSTLGAGTTFTIHLPLHDVPAETLASGTLATIAPRGTETVLLVEDEDAVRALGSRILERHGYTVIEARNGRDALSIASQYGASIDLLLTDVVMPEMGGKQLADTMLQRDPAVRVLFMSGYTDGDISRRGELNPDTAFIQKPFSARGLLSRVREVLDEDVMAAYVTSP